MKTSYSMLKEEHVQSREAGEHGRFEGLKAGRGSWRLVSRSGRVFTERNRTWTAVEGIWESTKDEYMHCQGAVWSLELNTNEC